MAAAGPGLAGLVGLGALGWLGYESIYESEFALVQRVFRRMVAARLPWPPVCTSWRSEAH